MEHREIIRRSPKITTDQLECIVAFLEQHPEMTSGSIVNPDEISGTKDQLWDMLAEVLNEMPRGPQKNGSGWKKCWIVNKSNIKRLASQKYKEMRKLGRRGSAALLELTDLQRRIVGLIKLDPISGIKSPKVRIVDEHHELAPSCSHMLLQAPSFDDQLQDEYTIVLEEPPGGTECELVEPESDRVPESKQTTFRRQAAMQYNAHIKRARQMAMQNNVHMKRARLAMIQNHARKKKAEENVQSGFPKEVINGIKNAMDVVFPAMLDLISKITDVINENTQSNLLLAEAIRSFQSKGLQNGGD